MDFPTSLRTFQLRWRFGLLLAGVLRAGFWAGLALLAFGLIDAYAGFSDPARRVVAGILVAVAAMGLLMALWRTLLFLRRDAAIAADRALGGPRREVLSALELQSRESDPDEDGLAGWLRTRAVQQAGARLGALRGASAFPAREVSHRTWQIGTLLAVLGLIAVFAPAASRIVARRLLDPGADVPPFSRLQFVLGPQPAKVLYGGEVVVTADITGGKLDAAVRCLTRDPATGRIDDSPAFHENAARFSRKLEKVAAPVEIAFAVGRARGAWLPVSVLMQPKVQDVMFTVDPPAYSGLPRREFAVGTQELAALPGSRITARVTSNRPLGGGALRIGVTGADAPAQEVAAEPEQTHRVRFTWIARHAARLSIEVRDVIGTRSEPLVLEQKLTPDARPEVALRQPAGDVLATPETELPLEASASDDLGLTRVSLVRQLRGYRERSQAQSAPPGQRRHELTGKLNLAAFGLVPGQIIELTLEAGDTNPNLLGISTSEPARVHIIAREKYAEILRNKTTLEDFAGRYEALRDAIEAARKSLEALEKAAESSDAAAAQAARQAALEAHLEAGKTLGALAKDFPLFDLDAGLSEASGKAMEQLFENAKELEKLALVGPDSLRDAVPELRERLGKGEQMMAGAMEQGERAIAAAEVFEQAGRFRELIAEQQELVKDFNRILEQIRRGETQAGQALRDLGRRQGEIAAGVRKLQTDLDAALKKLPEEFAGMAEEGSDFLEALAELEIPQTMDEGAAAGERGDGRIAGDRAGEALAELEALLRRKNGFCAMCRGEGEQPFSWPEDLAKTLEQLMRALVTKPGRGEGDEPGPGGTTGGGGGFGGRSDSGFAMRGKLPQLPIYGPSRQRFARNAGPQAGSGRGRGGSGPEGGADLEASQLAAQAQRAPGGAAMAPEAVPEAYREAVKRYFSPDETRGADSPVHPETKQP